jgi:EAL domain-containing protein (putative c-di-GMP-specific phosphodiesterase class I)
MGLQVIADGVSRAEDATLLFELGFDGVNAMPAA